MPVYIKQFDIQVSFEYQTSNNSLKGENQQGKLNDKEKAEIAAICMEKILEILQEKKER